jgi:hypothetical protein
VVADSVAADSVAAVSVAADSVVGSPPGCAVSGRVDMKNS